MSPQLGDWGETSANQVIALTEFFLKHYNIDSSRVYLHGMSGGGETGSLVEAFAYSGFKSGVMAMAETDVFTLADREADGNLSFREREGYAHDGNAANEYMYNALRFFWNADSE